jgi:multisubunit Na+/H+ antiporter MnhG subunit
VAPVALTAAAWLSDVTTAIALRMTLLAVLLVLQAPITAHVLGRATWIRGAATRGGTG